MGIQNVGDVTLIRMLAPPVANGKGFGEEPLIPAWIFKQKVQPWEGSGTWVSNFTKNTALFSLGNRLISA
jgi:hypothetical protein